MGAPGYSESVSLAHSNHFLLILVVTVQQVHHFPNAQDGIIIGNDQPFPEINQKSRDQNSELVWYLNGLK